MTPVRSQDCLWTGGEREPRNLTHTDWHKRATRCQSLERKMGRDSSLPGRGVWVLGLNWRNETLRELFHLYPWG